MKTYRVRYATEYCSAKTALSAQTGVSGVTYLGRGLRSDGGAIILLGAGAVVVAWTLWRVTTFL